MTAGEGDEGWGGGGGLQVPLSSGQVLLLAKNVLLFAELPFYFPELSFCFSEIPFCFLKLPFYFPKVSFCFTEVPFYFSKMPHFFPELSLRIVQNCLLFVFCAHLFFFFPANLTFSSSPAQGCSERDFPCSWFVSTWNSNLWCLLDNLKTFLCILFKS